VPHDGPFCDLMWSDPDEVESWSLSARGAGWIFGETVVKDFNQLNNLKLVCRSHQLVQEGYKYLFGKNLVTLWSAPNYCYRCGNDAAILLVDEKLSTDNYKIFKAACEPSALKNYRTAVPYFL